MRLEITVAGGHTEDENRELAKQRLLFALARFTPLLERAELTICEFNSSAGGMAVECRCQVIPKKGEPLVVENRDVTAPACIEACVKRMERTVARWVQRKQERQAPLPR